jgi:hypothetical protein
MSTEIDVGGDNDFASLYNDVRVNTEKQSICLVEKSVVNLMRGPMTRRPFRWTIPVTSETNPHMTTPKAIISLLLGFKNAFDLSGSSEIVFTLTEKKKNPDVEDSDSELVSVYFGVLGSTVLLSVEDDPGYSCWLESFEDAETGEVSLENINQIWANEVGSIKYGQNKYEQNQSNTGQMSLTDFATMITKQYIVPESKNDIDRVSAVLMGGHSRLGKHSPLHALGPDPLAMIIKYAETGPTVQAAMERLGVSFC